MEDLYKVPAESIMDDIAVVLLLKQRVLTKINH